MRSIFVVPAPGLSIRIPGRPAEMLPTSGASVPASQFWLRRISEGSVTIAEPAKHEEEGN